MEDNPHSFGSLWYIRNIFEDETLLGRYNTPLTNAKYSENVVSRKDGKVTMELVISPSNREN